MKLTQFLKNEKAALGLCTENGIIDVAEEARLRGLTAPATMLEAITGGEEARQALEALEKGATCFVTDPVLAPVVTGGDKVLCIGLNYRQHAKECNLAIPARPVLFNKFASSLSADGQVIQLLPEYKEYDHEAELVVVMGKKAKDVSPEEALSYVFGYTCGNDMSTRDLQFARGGQWVLSKALDGFGPIGPCVVTAECLDPNNLAIQSRVNGEIRQNSNTSDMIFPVQELISDLSHHLTLLPGDVIFTGTPQGVMHGYPADKKNWLKPGDTVEIEIEGIGTLKNTLA
ncbi:MAG: fumarylacetoacetate hydrolase family protein [Lachnospiraceae bacterium]|nr:fumarylacetoacetate hydrolase family protein [Lachnospiraceae bacterium]